LFCNFFLKKKKMFDRADAGVEAWCLQYGAPDPNACHKNRGLDQCRDKCLAVGQGFVGGACLKNPDGTIGDCVCLKCADQPPPEKVEH